MAKKPSLLAQSPWVTYLGGTPASLGANDQGPPIISTTVKKRATATINAQTTTPNDLAAPPFKPNDSGSDKKVGQQDHGRAGVVDTAGDFAKAAAFGVSAIGPGGPIKAALGAATGMGDGIANANQMPGYKDAYAAGIKAGMTPAAAAQAAAKKAGFFDRDSGFGGGGGNREGNDPRSGAKGDARSGGGYRAQ